MELELKKACFDAYEAAGELTLTQEETAETIVPDYCPDIARIIETTGKVFLHSREMRDGRAEISGTVRVTVLYTPEGEGGIRTLEFAMPFTVETDGRSLPDCAALLADTEPELLETRMLNPRKVFTHCKLVTRLTGYQRRPLCFCTDAEAGPELCIEKKQEQQHAIVLTHIAEKDFTFSEQMDLSPGREGAAEILTSRAASCCSRVSSPSASCTGRRTAAAAPRPESCRSLRSWRWKAPRRAQSHRCASSSPARICRSTAPTPRAGRSR